MTRSNASSGPTSPSVVAAGRTGRFTDRRTSLTRTRLFSLVQSAACQEAWVFGGVGSRNAGPELLFSKDGTFPRYIDSYKRPMVAV
jgi:hypothetical protein